MVRAWMVSMGCAGVLERNDLGLDSEHGLGQNLVVMVRAWMVTMCRAWMFSLGKEAMPWILNMGIPWMVRMD